ncbi:hypothetical protein [Gemmobacter sp. 24YEA27]|uniref:hypothetical protein n=1 Tax=Gemmobacter sp. 24YEA27 TaxID=3040672 RepID=UPI0024B35047|nr:hypothetical protein [Gemmobacter sp. 24YEA27]
MRLSLQRDARAIRFDQRQLEDGIGFRLLDASVAPREPVPDLLLVQSAIGEAVNRVAFDISAGAITLNPSLSRQIYDAADRAAVRERLAAAL